MSELEKKRVHWKEYNGDELIHDEDVDVLTSADAVTFDDGETMQYKYNQGQFVSPSDMGVKSNLSTTNKSTLVDAINEVKTATISNESSIDNLTKESVGKNLGGQTVSPTLDTTVIAGTNAEIFNDYRTRTYNTSGYISAGNIASGNYSHAEGKQTTASGKISHAEGEYTTASGYASHAEGYETTASGVNSHAEGHYARAIGDKSHAEGYYANASGSYSHAEGGSTTADGVCSHAEGNNTTASGACSHAGGSYTIASNYQLVHGKYNKESAGATSSTDMTGDIFIIGNGIRENERGNALRTTTAGKTYGLDSFAGSGAGVAELFEWQDGNSKAEDRRGLFVTLDGEKIKIASPDDRYILGVIDPCPYVVGDVQSEIWKDMYLRDIFGQKLTETVEIEETTDENGKIIPAHTEKRWLLNPEYDPTQTYVSREDRKEFDAITSKGKVVMIDDGTCQVNGYCTVGQGGKATASDTNYSVRVLKRIDETHILVYIDSVFLNQ